MNAVLKRKVLYVQAQFESPVNVSSGENEVTDSDVLRDCNGTPFITGSSLAGAMRAYIEKEKKRAMPVGILRWRCRKNEFSFYFRSDI